MEQSAKEEMEDRLKRFHQWMEVNGAPLKGCYIKSSADDIDAGLGFYTAALYAHDEILMVTPLVLAITPMTVLQDPLVGPLFGNLFADAEVDDRHVMMLYLMVQRALRDSSFWEPYINILPTEFGTPLLFTEEELLELKGSSLFNATKIQKATLGKHFDERVKPIVESILESIDCNIREVRLEDYMWANCVYWTRALSFPCPHSLVVPQTVPISVSSVHQSEQAMIHEIMDVKGQILDSESSSQIDHGQLLSSSHLPQNGAAFEGNDDGQKRNDAKVVLPDNVEQVDGEQFQRSPGPSTEFERSEVSEDHPPEMVEGLVPGIDFCNHAIQGVARWEIDGRQGSVTGVPNSMYLVTGPTAVLPPNTEVTICYGNKSNEELLYLYGFVLDTNSDDYLMVHFPVQALENGDCSEAKSQLIENQELPLRWLLNLSMLEGGYLSELSDKISQLPDQVSKAKSSSNHCYSWSGQRKPPPSVQYQIFPEEMIESLRILAMTEEEVQGVQNLLIELSESSGRLPSKEDVKAAIWEVCGDSGALQLLQDLLASRVLELEEGTGPEDLDSEILEKHAQAQVELTKMHQHGRDDKLIKEHLLSKNNWASVIYRKGQKNLARKFLQEVECALERWIG